MANARDVFSVAAASVALGTAKPPAPVARQPEANGYEAFTTVDVGSAPLARFIVNCRDGRVWSYPYSFVGLIDCPSGERLVLNCICGTIKTIEFKGRGLRELATYLAAGRVQTITETASAAFTKEPTVVAQVLIELAKRQ